MKNNAVDIKKISKLHENTEIRIEGWIRYLRKSKNIAFIDIFDGTTIHGFQIIVKKANFALFQELDQFGTGDAISCDGTIIINNNNNNYEMLAKKIDLVAKNNDSPLQSKKHTLEFMRTIPQLRCKTKTFQSIFKIRKVLFLEIQKFFQQENYIYIHAPILTINDAEGSGEVFNVTSEANKNFFDKKVYLGVSGQLYSEALAQAFKKVYTFAPTFRSDKSNTTKHAAEFWMLEPEASFCHLFDMIDLAEKMLKYLGKQILKKCEKEIIFCSEKFEINLSERILEIINKDFQKISYTEAIALLLKNVSIANFVDKNIFWGMDLATEHEKYLAGNISKGPIFIYDYPKKIKAFYMKQNDDNKTVRAMDLLIPAIGELIGGSERENDYEKLIAEIKLRNMDAEQLKWYIDLRKYGYAPSSGFGLGFERLIMYFTGTPNIRDVIFFPRTTGRVLI